MLHHIDTHVRIFSGFVGSEACNWLVHLGHFCTATQVQSWLGSYYAGRHCLVWDDGSRIVHHHSILTVSILPIHVNRFKV